MRNYQVKPRDTLWKIGEKFGVSVDALARANNLTGRRVHFLRVDQNLQIPEKDGPGVDTVLSIKFRGLDHRPFLPSKVKVEHDGDVMELALNGLGEIALAVRDHASGLKVWIEDLNKQFVKVLERQVLPLGRWNVSVDSRQVALKGNLQLKNGSAQTTASTVRAATTHNSRETKGVTARAQTRTEGGKPVHVLASLYTEENLRLLPGNECYRRPIIDSAKKHGTTPQCLAALIDAEAAKIKGVWQERSNETHPRKAQGLAQFFEAAWDDVFKCPESLLWMDCRGETKEARLSKRLVAKYAIDGAAVYANLNLRNFARISKFPVNSLLPEDKAKLAYFLHHEGLGGALALIGIGKSRQDEYYEALLGAQLGKTNSKKLEALIARYGGDPEKAYKAWLFSYIDNTINVNHFLIKDAASFVKQPRSIGEILAGFKQDGELKKSATELGKPPQPPEKRPTEGVPDVSPRSKEPSKAVQPEQTVSLWHDPLDRCTLRTARLASKTGAKFGMTRKNKNGQPKPHQGIDLEADPGTPVHAVAAGRVLLASTQNGAGDYGKCLILVVGVDDLPPRQAALARELNGNQKTIAFFYAHLSEWTVPHDAKVVTGAVIGKTGCTGNAKTMTTISNGSHLHFEVRKDYKIKAKGLKNRVDPLLFITNCTNS